MGSFGVLGYMSDFIFGPPDFSGLINAAEHLSEHYKDRQDNFYLSLIFMGLGLAARWASKWAKRDEETLDKMWKQKNPYV